MQGESSRRHRHGSSRNWPTACSITYSISKTAGENGTGRSNFDDVLLQADRYEAWIAVRRNHKQNRCFLAVLLELLDALLKVGRTRHRLLLNLGDDHPRRKALFGSG